jgi:lipopolysaccharide transport system ATP-binding protein
MSKLAIKAENISKQYRLGEVGTGTLSHDLNRFWHKVLGKEDPYLQIGQVNDRSQKADSNYVWSLKDINFEIEQGDAVGIIGRNGAGKSTLLKLLSKVTKPTTGRFHVNGRIASLLEVGTGFNPEMTGRENIYMNGAILGMRRHEITRKFDEIVAFSGVEAYIDTPVKRYSSGMYVRLAFAVAAHLESEILIVDEVLAVGDAEFQKKCLGKMGDVSKGEGRTVLFVSHNMAAVKSLCNKGIVLQNGEVVFQGTQHDASNYYQSFHEVNPLFNYDGNIENAPGNHAVRILRFEVKGRNSNKISMTSGINFELEFYNTIVNQNIDITFELVNQEDVFIFHKGTIINSKKDSKKGIYSLVCELPQLFLNTGNYSINIIFGENQRTLLYQIKNFISFEVLHEMAGSNSEKLPGVTFPDLKFNITEPND